MSDLIKIINQEGNLLVSSREVATNFEKEHKNILRDIDNIMSEGVAQNWADLFYETSYTHPQNKQEYREILMNKDGFTLLAMGFTGQKALNWKLKYIETFNKMAIELKEPKKLSPMEQLKLQYEVLDEHDERLTYLENNMTIDFGQQNNLKNKSNSKVVSALGGINSHAYKNKSLRSKIYSAIWRDYKDYFNVASYRDTARVDFQKALDYLDGWQVQGRLLREIEDCNNQIDVDEIA